ncbi:hypothetical protein [Streptomyces variabilis]
MAMRGGPARRLVGNPLGGLLRSQERAARRPTRRTGTPAPAEAAPEVVEEARPVVRTSGAGAAAVVSTGPGGRAVWCPDPSLGELVVSAVVAGPGGPFTVSVLEDEPGRVVLQVWELVRHGRGMRWTEAGACVRVHVTGSRPSQGG